MLKITAGVIAKDDRVFLGVLLVTQDKRVPRVLLVSSVLFSAESMLRDVKLKAVEATTVTARARSARDEARKLVSQAVTLKVVCSAPESDWSQSEEASGGVEIMGMTGSHVRSARVAIESAFAPAAGGKRLTRSS